MKRLLAPLLFATTLGGCIPMHLTMPGHLYPVNGPLSKDKPLPIYDVSMRLGLRSGTMRVTLPSGEVCSGDLMQIRANDPSAGDASADWDGVYGQGYFVANVLGSPYFARAVLTGAEGTTLSVEAYNPTGAEHTRTVIGIAKDNRGDVFKLTF